MSSSIFIARQDREEDRPRLPDPKERARLLTYLGQGRPVGADGARTDGVWIWTETDLRHLRDRALRPDPELCRHAAARRYVPPQVDETTAVRAERAWQAALLTRTPHPATPPIVTGTEAGTLTVAGDLTARERAILDEMLGGPDETPGRRP
ncbi:hypothetical protein AB0I81_42050 [Nonomuraea sp. NPDC050404]|uniref:hypothetical protein n=1 Tax=Nonomuraea sp. NPDC050404 TaxID=3155783 RepID=UPI0033F7ADC8